MTDLHSILTKSGDLNMAIKRAAQSMKRPIYRAFFLGGDSKSNFGANVLKDLEASQEATKTAREASTNFEQAQVEASRNNSELQKSIEKPPMER